MGILTMHNPIDCQPEQKMIDSADETMDSSKLKLHSPSAYRRLWFVFQAATVEFSIILDG